MKKKTFLKGKKNKRGVENPPDTYEQIIHGEMWSSL